MAESEIDHESATPVYRQIAAYLIADIERGLPAVGRRIPSESALVQRFGVARETARNAVAYLRDKGYVHTVPQRGSFVVDRSGEGSD
ncbi:winged helix-turn-helix transcriptional regulator [Streptomyces lunaelactis]|uniref:GntR family transcriptional regulator n=1 Tax=Streptomyces lunaelactis TaxID=1535768 RepID=UPI001585CCCE|nr:winged helix-turn-helix domain-containing protein [Streptomyces lunaelactis]NUK09728.1 winged helix-turn-helix transcriptional regulator [Streptomyces lunaelactis]